MALTDERGGNGFYMPVAPAYSGGYGGGGLFDGGNGWWIILLLLCGWGGMGFGGFGGGMMWPMMMGGMGGDWGLYPWLNNSQNINDGFRDQMLQTSVTGIGDKITSGFGDVQLGIAGLGRQICETGNGISGAIRDGFYGAETAANARQMATMQQLFGIQSQAADCCCKTQTGIQDLKYTEATEACATRTANYQNTRDIIDNQNRVGQSILDKLCQLELDGYKQRLDAKDDTIGQLRSQLSMAQLAASQTAQTAEIRTSQATTANQLVSELRSCPIPATPVAGNVPLFSCNPGFNNGTGCGCGNGFAN